MPAPDHRTRHDTDVIVVGAGPIGLATACALRHHGVDCRVLEERTEPKPYSRANNLWARPQELLAAVGIRDALAEKAYRTRRANSFLNGRPIDPIELNRVASPYPDLLYSGQDIIETTLNRALAGKGGVVDNGRKVVGIEPDDEGVTVAVVDASDRDGPAERLRCRYLVGADGDAGTVRKAVDLDFEKTRFEGWMNRQVDAKLHWRRPTDFDQIWFFYYHNGFCGVLPVSGGYHRLYFLQDDAGVPDRDPTLEEIQALAREVVGDDTLTLTDPIWLTHSRFQYGVAPHYARGRVFLVGDAGHHTLPIGGQGMNAGFHDAVGLAWRLAMTLAGGAEPVVLDSYDSERGGEHARLGEQQATGFRRAVYRGPATDLALDVGARVLPNLASLIQGTDDLHQLSVNYPGSALNEDHLGGLGRLLHAKAPRAGDRAPDAEVATSGGRGSGLFPHLYNPDGRSWGWALLAFDGRRQDAAADLGVALGAVAGWEWVRPRLVLAAPVPEAGGDGVTTLFDLDAHAHNAYGLDGRPALVLVRPDGHIAFRGPADRPELLRAYCEKVFGLPPARAA